MAFLLDLGVERRDGKLRFEVEMAGSDRSGWSPGFISAGLAG